jgi:hypothetical protein
LELRSWIVRAQMVWRAGQYRRGRRQCDRQEAMTMTMAMAMAAALRRAKEDVVVSKGGCRYRKEPEIQPNHSSWFELNWVALAYHTRGLHQKTAENSSGVQRGEVKREQVCTTLAHWVVIWQHVKGLDVLKTIGWW